MYNTKCIHKISPFRNACRVLSVKCPQNLKTVRRRRRVGASYERRFVVRLIFDFNHNAGTYNKQDSIAAKWKAEYKNKMVNIINDSY